VGENRTRDLLIAANRLFQVEVLQLRSDNERMQRTIVRNGLKDDDVELYSHSPGGDTGAGATLQQKKLSIGDPTTFGLTPKK